MLLKNLRSIIMAQSSIHIAKGKANYLSHNSRETPTNNSIFSDEKNEVSNNTKKAFEIYRTELAKRTQAYTARTNKKLHKNTVTHLSAIVNLNKHHTLRDLEQLKEHLENTLGTKVFQIAVHRDEGHINEQGEAIKNYHAHIEMLGLDEQGNSIRRKLTRNYLRDLQTKTAQILQMQRGQRNSKAVRLDTYEYKEHAKQQAKAVKAKTKDLKAEISQLREQLKQAHAERKQYAELEAKQKELKELIKAKDLTVSQLQNEVQQLQQKLLFENMQQDTIKIQQNTIEMLQQENERLQKQNAEQQQTIEQLQQQVQQLQQQVQAHLYSNKSLNEQLKQAKEQLKQYAERTETAQKSTNSPEANQNPMQTEKSQNLQDFDISKAKTELAKLQKCEFYEDYEQYFGAEFCENRSDAELDTIRDTRVSKLEKEIKQHETIRAQQKLKQMQQSQINLNNIKQQIKQQKHKKTSYLHL